MTLTEFLLARIAEDVAVRVTRLRDGRLPTPRELREAERWEAECEAKRRIVEMQWHHFGEDDYAWGMEEAKRQILAVMALPYADHPDFREEWRP